MASIISKTIITKSRLPLIDYCFNPYIGCTHRCTYCYARFMGRFSGYSREDWGTYLDWKSNASDLLEKELPKVKETGGRVILGSVTDCYQPIETTLMLTRKSLKVFLKHQIPIAILTKSSLIERDLDLLKEFDDCQLGISLSLLDSSHVRILEPGTSNPESRLSTLKTAHDNAIPTYLFLGPIHPFLSPVEEILKRAIDRVDNIMGETPNLSCGNWTDMKKSLEALNIAPDEYKTVAKSETFFNSVYAMINNTCKEYSLQFSGLFKH